MTSAVSAIADTWGMHDDDVGWGWMMVMGPLMMLFWVVVVIGVIWFFRRPEHPWSRPAESPAKREGPLEILDRRFAEGAISPEDYRARRSVLLAGTEEPRSAGEGELH